MNCWLCHARNDTNDFIYIYDIYIYIYMYVFFSDDWKHLETFPTGSKRVLDLELMFGTLGRFG